MPIRVIHVGVGGRGVWPVRLIAQRQDFKSVALVDVNEDNLAKAREMSGLGKEACFRGMSEALNAVEADAALVITPPDMHAGQCLQAVRAGKHVMVEKPFTKSLKEAHQIVSEARQRGLKVAVCQNARYAPQFLTIHKLVRERTYGAPSFGLMTKYGWRPRAHHSGHDQHSYLWERGVHDFDTVRFMFDARPKRVWCHSFNPSWSPYRGGAGIHAWIEFDNGATCGFLCTFGAHAGGSSLRIELEGGTLQQVGNDLHIQKPGQQQAETVPLVQASDAETILLNGFLKDIQDGVEPEFSGRQNLITVGLVECLGVASDRGAVLDFDAYMQETLGARE